MNSYEFAYFDSAILEKPDENFPACWTVVKWPALTCSVYGVKIHSGAKLNLKPVCVTHKPVTNGTDKIPGKRAALFGKSKQQS
jgi:hypothetical protein